MSSPTTARRPERRAQLIVDEGATVVDPTLLAPLSQQDLRCIWRDQAALLLDRELRKLARARSLVDLRLCQLLARLGPDGASRLGFARLTDFGRERLGLSARYVRDLARVGRRLEELPVLRRAMERGELGLSQVRQLVRVAGNDEGDQRAWIDLARRHTVRRLEQLVREHLAGRRAPLDDHGAVYIEESAERFHVAFRAPARLEGKWCWALELARRVCGAELTSGQALELVLMEFFSGMLERLEGQDAALEPEEGVERGVARTLESGRALRRATETLTAILEQVSRDWAFLEWAAPEVALAGWSAERPGNAFEADALLQRLMRVRKRVEWELEQLALSFSRLGLHRELQFASAEHFARERLDMSGRAFRRRVQLARRCLELPALGQAVEQGRLGSVAAQWVGRVATLRTAEAWVERAGSVTLRALEAEARPVAEQRRERLGELPPRGPYRPGVRPERQSGPVEPWSAGPVERDAERPTCAAGEGFVGAEGPTSAAGEGAGEETSGPAPPVETTLRCQVSAEGLRLWNIGLRLCRQVWGQELADWECAERMVDHFIEIWGRTDEAPPFAEVLERDGYQCAVPGCRNRRNLSVHHVRFRSRGGGDEPENLITVCFDHHIQGIHEGKLRCRGRAPERLIWELGLRPDGRPVARYLGDRRLTPWSGCVTEQTYSRAS